MTLKDDLIKHKIFVQRFSATEFKEIDKELKKLSKLAERQVATNKSAKTIRNTLRKSIESLHEAGFDRMSEFAIYESEFSARVFKKHIKADIKTPKQQVVVNKLAKNNMQLNNASELKTRKSIKNAYKQFARRKADELAQVISDGKVMGLSIKDIQKQVRAKSLGLHRVQAQTLSYTVVNYSAVIANDATIEANKGLFKHVLWVSVLDSDTTEYCKEHNGNVYPVGEGPRPLAHWRCRSMVVPIIK